MIDGLSQQNATFKYQMAVAEEKFSKLREESRRFRQKLEIKDQIMKKCELNNFETILDIKPDQLQDKFQLQNLIIKNLFLESLNLIQIVDGVFENGRAVEMPKS